MAYSSATSDNKTINYLNKDFSDFKDALINIAQIYYPDTVNDFTEASPGTMFIEMASYIGDVLSFYTDAQVQETFLQYAQERENLYSLAYTLGYIPVVTNAAAVELEIFQQIPANSDGNPDYDYALRIRKNSTFKPNNNSGVEYLTQNDVNFAFSSSFDTTEETIYSTVSTQPDYFLLKKKVKAISAELKTETFAIANAERFKTLSLDDTRIIGIQSIIDSEGNEYTEVPYLAQETIFDEIPNTEVNDPELKQYQNQVPFLLRTKKVAKRFVTRFKSDKKIEIQFGAGATSGDDTTIIPNPDNIGLGINDGRSLLDRAYDPSNFLFTKAYGEVPSNTTLTVTYLKGGGVNSNANANVINRVGTLTVVPNKGNLNTTVFNAAINSIACNNPFPAKGGGDGDSSQDIRLNAIANFSAQKRTVTKEDYIFRSLSMPPQFGKVAKAYIVQDTQISMDTSKRISNPNALNLYTLGYDYNKKLASLSYAAKVNLGTYLEQYRMLTDAINIKEASVINFKVEFDISVRSGFSNDQVLITSINSLKAFFNINNWQINEPINIGDISSLLYGINGIQTLNNVTFTNVFGENSGYSKFKYNFDAATRNGTIYPSLDPSIFELKYPNTDIIGRVTN
tara:strand:- start:4790 stop:6664 length:1875 start_codon:yes stop_codon:yes gene_type:complete